MREVAISLAPLLLVGVGAVALYALVVIGVSMLMLPDYKVPNVPWSELPFLCSWNPRNIIFLPQYLTEQGKRVRRRLILHLLLFIATIMVPGTIAMVAVKLGFKL